MKRLVSSLVCALSVLVPSLTASAQPLPVPPQFAQIATLKTQAASSLQAMLQPRQRQQIAIIGRRTERELDRSFGDVNSADGPVMKIFTGQQLLSLAEALRGGQMPALDEAQMASLTRYVGDVVMRAGPTWQRGSSQVDAVLSVQQRTAINALRTATFAKLPHISFMGFDLFGALSEGAPLGGFFSDPGAFALLLSLPVFDRFAPVPLRQTQTR